MRTFLHEAFRALHGIPTSAGPFVASVDSSPQTPVSHNSLAVH